MLRLTVVLTCLACNSISRALLQIDYGGAFVQISAFIMLQVSSILSATVMRNLMLSAIELSTVRLQLYLSEVLTLAESSVLVERVYRHRIPAFISSILSFIPTVNENSFRLVLVVFRHRCLNECAHRNNSNSGC